MATRRPAPSGSSPAPKKPNGGERAAASAASQTPSKAVQAKDIVPVGKLPSQVLPKTVTAPDDVDAVLPAPNLGTDVRNNLKQLIPYVRGHLRAALRTRPEVCNQFPDSALHLHSPLEIKDGKKRSSAHTSRRGLLGTPRHLLRILACTKPLVTSSGVIRCRLLAKPSLSQEIRQRGKTLRMQPSIFSVPTLSKCPVLHRRDSATTLFFPRCWRFMYLLHRR